MRRVAVALPTALVAALALLPAPAAVVPVAGVAALGLVGCGPSCGNAETEEGEECDDGNDNETDACRGCRSFRLPRTTVKWSFNDEPSLGFGGDGCLDVGAADVEVTLTGAVERTSTEECSNKQVVFDNLPPGPYTVAFMPVNAGGFDLLDAPHTVTVMAEQADTTHETVIPYTAWSNPYTGTFYFQLTWAGASCAAATPVVATQVLTLRVDGQAVAQVTDTGQALTGADPQACRASTGTAQSVEGLPLGPAELEVVGLDGTATEVFATTHQTFIGAGISNPILVFDQVASSPP